MGKFTTQMFPPSPAFTESSLSSLTGKVFIVTGGNSGVGLELVKILYAKGAKVYILCRSQEKAEGAINSIRQSVSSTSTAGEIKFLHLDLADLATIKPP